MIIDRRTFVVKKGRMQEAAQLLLDGKSDGTWSGIPGKVMVAAVGPFDVLCTELTFTDWDEYHGFWDETFDPEQSWWERWNEVTLPGGGHEVWQVLG